jgi:ATP adenylyltransferase
MEYIEGPKDDECIFCARRDYVVAEGERCFVMLNAYPYTNGHVMVSPYEHVPSLEELDDTTMLELMTLVRRSLGAIRDAYGPEGFNIGVNQGKVAGAGIEEHVHMHVVPRWGGDTNYMPVTGGVRVLPQSLDDSLRELRAAFGS